MIDIVKIVEESILKEQRVYPCRSNRSSQLGHPCERYLVYMRTHWEQQQLPTIDKLFIFQGGNLIEKMALMQLEKAGFNPTNQGRDYEDKRYQITGHLDTMLTIPELKEKQGNVPAEIKGISPFEFDKIDSLEDMTLSKKHWMRGYPAQLQLYLFLAEKEMGLFYIINKLTYKPKVIWMQIDFEFCEQLVKKAERINAHVKAETLPERISDFDVCMNCSFRHICLPDLKAMEGVQILDSIELEEQLERLEELKEAYSEYNELNEGVKKTIEGKDKLSVGQFFITGKYIEFKKAAEIERTVKYWKSKIIRV